MASVPVPKEWHDPDPYQYTDHVFKVAHGVPISLRVWPAVSTTTNKQPWLFWIHGGGFCAGYAERMARWIQPGFLSRGYHLVSINYRLCPQVSFQEQLDDVTDAWTWCHENLPRVLGDTVVDVRRCAVAGDSAGGCFASLSGFHFEPKPKVIVNLYGPVQLRHPHFHTPATNYKEQLARAKYLKRGTEEELQAALVDNDPSKAKTRYVWWHDMGIPIERLRGFLGVPDLEVDEDQKLRMDMYTYMSITRTRFSSVFRRHTFQTEDEFQAELDKFSSLSKIKQLPPSSNYPPTFFIHGDADSAVPIGPSKEFYDQLEDRDVDCEARWAEGADHSFDAFIDGPQHPAWGRYIEPCLRFIDRHIDD